LVFFLHTHFTTKRETVGNSRMLYFQQQLFRFFAFDKNDLTIPGDPLAGIPDRIVEKNFKNLTLKISLDNAMLIFLDGRLNVKGRPNENYGRELLELYSIGRGLEGSLPAPAFDGDYFNYTEQDVQAAARVLSGFDVDTTLSTIDPDTGLPMGNVRGAPLASSHDNDPKTFSLRMNNQVIEPDPALLNGGLATEESAIDEIRQLIDLIYSNEETAHNICRKLYRFFVYHQIDATIESTIIQDMATLFIANNFKLQPVLEALFSSLEFYEGLSTRTDDVFGSIIKSPLDLTMGFIRQFGLQVPDYLQDPAGFYSLMGDLSLNLQLMGLNYYEPYEVAGYPAYHQYPIYHRGWITTNYLTNRYNFVRNHLTETTEIVPDKVHLLNFVTNTFLASVYTDGQLLVKTLVSYFLPIYENADFVAGSTGDITAERMNFFLQEFLYKEGLGEKGEAAWTLLWQPASYDAEIASERLSFLFNALLQSPEYQLM
ncbi:MAG: DUF1800 domain-containing protein, partial [Cyclobacteriaceae bacterium]|nr:DUF1800 domain-containing protein [Cyclobacteriaceae bacterium]